MKRIIVSIFGGIICPILIAFLAAFIAQLLPQYPFLDTMRVKGMASPGLLYAPVAIPFWMCDYIRFYQYFGLRMFFDTVWFRAIFTLSFNFLLYAGLTYLFLWYFGLFKSSKPIIYQDPPSPPQF